MKADNEFIRLFVENAVDLLDDTIGTLSWDGMRELNNWLPEFNDDPWAPNQHMAEAIKGLLGCRRLVLFREFKLERSENE